MAADRSHELPSTIRDLLVDVRKKIRYRVLVDGLLVAAIVVLTIYWLGAALDYLPVKMGSNETPRWVRLALLCAMSILVSWALLWRLARSYLARFSDRSMAVLLERHFPQLNNELVTVVELADKSTDDISNPAAYRIMLNRVQQSASQRVATIDTGRLFNWRPVWWFGSIAGLLLLWTVGVAIATPAWISLWNARLFALSDQRWPRLAHLEMEGVQIQLPAFTGQLAADRVVVPFTDKLAHVPRGAAVTLNAKADAEARLVPELCTLFYQLNDGARGRANMRRLGAATSGWQSFMLDGPPLVDLVDTVNFDIVGGDARLDDYILEVIDPAVIKSMQLQVTYPPYLLASRTSLPLSELLEFRSGLRIPEGTQVVLKGSASGTLKTVQYVLRQSSGSSNRKSSAKSTNGSDQSSGSDEIMIRSVQPHGSEFELPLGVLAETTVIEIRLLDEYGLTSDQIPRYVVAVSEDAVPEVEAKLVGIGTAVTPNAVLPLTGKATDDHGLSRTWATVVINEQPPVEIDVEVDDEGKFGPSIDLEKLAEAGKLRPAPDATLGIALSASDRFDLGGMKHVGNGQSIQLAIVNKDRMTALIDRQELELRQRLELIIGELGQLRDVLSEQANVNIPTTQATRQLKTNLAAYLPQAQEKNSQPAASADNAGSAADDPVDADKKDPEQQRKLMLLRAQQSVVQGDKSHQELVGVANLVNDIRLQLVNNRIDSVDRQARLNDKVYEPLQKIIASEMQSLRTRLTQFQTAAMSPTGGPEQAALAVHENERLLASLNDIVANMLELAGMNEILDELRGFRDQQQELLKATQEKRNTGIRDLLEAK